MAAVLLPLLLLPSSSDLTVGLYGARTGLSWSSEGNIMVLGVIRGLRVGFGAIVNRGRVGGVALLYRYRHG